MPHDQILRAVLAIAAAGTGGYSTGRLLQRALVRRPLRPPLHQETPFVPEPEGEAAPGHRIRHQIREAGLQWSWGTFLALSATAAASLALFVGRAFVNPYAAALALLVGARLPYEYVAFLRDRRRDLIRRHKADALGGIVTMQTTYPSWPAAIEQSLPLMVGPLRTEFARVVQEYAAGIPFPQALHTLALRLRDPDVTGFVSLILSSRESGADPAQACRDLLVMIQDRQREQMDLRTETVAPRISVYGVVLLGVWYFYKRFQTDPWSHYVYTGTITGQLLVAGALVIVLVTLVALNKLTTMRT